MNKICIYAICKNEKQFVDTWLNSMSEADYYIGDYDRSYIHVTSALRLNPHDSRINSNYKLIDDKYYSIHKY